MHWVIIVTAIWILIDKSQLPNNIKLFFVFGYFAIYEFAAISRNYALCMLLIFLSCYLVKQSRFRLNISVAIVLILLANTHLFGLIYSLGLLMILIVEQRMHKRLNINNIYLIIIVVAGMLIAIYQIIPPLDHFLLVNHNQHSVLSMERLIKAVAIPFKALFVLPNFSLPHYWNSNYFTGVLPTILIAPLVVISWVLPLWLLRSSRMALGLYGFTLLSICGFTYLSPLNVSLRHAGFIYMVWIASYWLMYTQKEQESNRFSLSWKYLLYVPFVLHLAAGIGSIYKEVASPFSEALNVSTYLQEQGLDQLMVATTQNSGASLSAYLDKKAFYLDKNRLGSFCSWDDNSFSIDKEFIYDNLIQLSQNQKSFVVALEYPLAEYQVNKMMDLKYLTKFERSVVSTENFYLYLYRDQNAL